MKNKFEALTAFQSWPEEWQRLCAEYWTETDKPKMEAMPFPTIDNPFSHGERRTYITKANKAVTQQRWTVAQQEYLVACVDRSKTQKEAAREFLVRYPGRTINAVRFKISAMMKSDGIMEVKY